MTSPPGKRNAKEVFLEAIDLDSPEERRQFLDRNCDGDRGLRRRVEALIAAHDDPESYLDRPAARFDVTETTDGNSGGSGLSDSSSHHGRFLPGTNIANRYRIVSLLGRGGMGEVYRADDLRLGQTVALKFLPPELAKDRKRLEYFHNEVKLARQISHPNICRVYDIGEIDGQHFISMEYIDGEDLKALLHRIGRLPQDKGIELAQQLCGGVSAAHANGVLHRDLKPANIMIDGHGRVRITDFGLATVSAEGESVLGLSGTPAYMAPEQLLAGQTSVQSDIYSVGLILFELFTGHRANPADSIAELRRLHEESSSPSDPGDFVSDLDPAVQNAIRRCLSADPAERPDSMRDLVAALPGGDPLAAALAAGETPPPEIVAAAGKSGRLSLRNASLCLLSVFVGLLAIYFLADRTHFVNSVGLQKSAEILKYEAVEILNHLGYETRGRGSVYGFEGIHTWEELAGIPPGFWYRESQDALIANQFFKDWANSGSRVSFEVPAWTQPDMLGLKLSPTGRLRYFRAVPPSDIGSGEAIEPDWPQLFPKELTGIDLTELQVADWTKTPPDACEHVKSWQGNHEGESAGVHVQAAAYRGVPTYFEIISERDWDSNEQPESTSGIAILYAFLAMLAIVTVCTAVLAWRHWHLRRGDRRGAVRYAMFMLAIGIGQWLCETNHVTDWRELYLLIHGLNVVAGIAIISWLNYMALEPLMRKHWPEMLISWARVLAGRFSDPRVGRDVLAGVLFQVGLSVYLRVNFLVFDTGSVNTYEDFLMGPTSVINAFLMALWPVNLYIYYFAVVIVLLALTRSKYLAIGCYVLMMTVFATSLEGWQNIEALLFFFFFLAQGVFLARFGFFAWLFSGTLAELLNGPITTDFHAFYYRTGLLALFTVFAAAVWGFYVSVGGYRGLIAGFQHEQAISVR